MNQAPRTLSYNPAENAVLLTSDVDGGSYELYKIPKDARGDSAPVGGIVVGSLLVSAVSFVRGVPRNGFLAQLATLLFINNSKQK